MPWTADGPRAFQTHRRCKSHDHVCHVDGVSLHPPVNELAEHTVGFRQHDMIHDTSIGLVGCDVAPNMHLIIPALPSHNTGELSFHNNTMAGAWSTQELQKALDMCFKTTKALSAVKYHRWHGLMADDERCVSERISVVTYLETAISAARLINITAWVASTNGEIVALTRPLTLHG